MGWQLGSRVLFGPQRSMWHSTQFLLVWQRDAALSASDAPVHMHIMWPFHCSMHPPIALPQALPQACARVCGCSGSTAGCVITCYAEAIC